MHLIRSNSTTKLFLVSPPDIIDVQPVGDIYPNHNKWTIKFDKQVLASVLSIVVYNERVCTESCLIL